MILFLSLIPNQHPDPSELLFPADGRPTPSSVDGQTQADSREPFSEQKAAWPSSHGFGMGGGAASSCGLQGLIGEVSFLSGDDQVSIEPEHPHLSGAGLHETRLLEDGSIHHSPAAAEPRASQAGEMDPAPQPERQSRLGSAPCCGTRKRHGSAAPHLPPVTSANKSGV